MRVRLVACFLVAVFAAFTSRAAFASALITINGSPLDAAALNCSISGDQTICRGTNLQGSGFMLSSWEFLFDPDPSVSGAFTVLNLSATTQTFTIGVGLGVLPLGSTVSATGFTGAGTLTDLNGGGATLTDNGISIYTALIDGTAVHTLLDPPQSYISTPLASGGPGAPVTIPFSSFGPNILAQPVNSIIGTQFQFRLTSGDQVSLPFGFTVTPVAVPESDSLTLLGCGIVCLAAFRRRRAA